MPPVEGATFALRSNHVKVLYVVPHGQDLGGIITSSEHLMQGFREAGHKATFALLRSGNARGSEPRGQHADDYIVGPGSGMLMHPVHGWRGPCYTTDNPDKFIALANEHDIVVWGALYGLRNSKTEGTTGWLRCITDHKAKNVFMVRDDHLEKRVPWAMAFAPFADGWAGVQQCSFESVAGLAAPTALIFSGHGPTDASVLKKRRKGVLAVATWKGWKNPRIMLQSYAETWWEQQPLTLAGDGIELRYMRSEEKARDKDYTPAGWKIWDGAVGAGMNYVGSIQEEERDNLMRNHLFLADFSYRENSGQINRSVVEAMRNGCIPIADPRFISGNAEGIGELFRADVHYLPIHVKRDDVGEQMTKLLRTKPAILNQMRQTNFDRVDAFSRKIAANELVKLGMGKWAGFKYAKPEIDKDKIERGNAAFREIFGELPK